MADDYRKLDDEQLKSFDRVYITDENWRAIVSCIESCFPSGDFHFLDVGGGNGVFSDRILEHFPKSRCTLLDNSELLLELNKANPRKNIIRGSAMELEKLFPEQKFDIIFFNWILHHLIARSYQSTLRNIRDCLKQSKSILSTKGRICIFENMYNGCLIDSMPSRTIFLVTSIKSIGRIVRKLGANTGGVGVCFLSKKQWNRMLASAGLEIERYIDDPEWNTRKLYKILLNLDGVNVRHYWCK